MKTKTHITPNRKLIISESFRAFLERHMNDNRVARLLHAAATQPHPAYSMVISDALNYLTNRSDGTISYLPKGKECKLTPEGLWARSARQEGKPARVLNRLFTKSALRLFKESELEYFSNLYNAATYISSYARIEIISGDAIAEAYNYNPSKISTCMTGDDTDGFFDIYTRNPQTVNMMVMYDDRRETPELIGRALIWNISGKRYLDRIYSANPDCGEYFKQYAMDNGFIVKAYQTFSEKNIWQRPDGTTFEENLTVRLKTNFDKYPYLDTFTYGGFGYLTNNQIDNHQYRYTDTDGGRVELLETVDGDWIEADEAVWSDYYNGYLIKSDCIETSEGWFKDSDVEATIVIFIPEGCEGQTEFSPSELRYKRGHRILNGSRAGEFVSGDALRRVSNLF